MDQNRRNQEEARTLFEILQDHVIPLYYARGPMGSSPGWVALAKRSIASIVPRFNSVRMLSEYISKFYLPASLQWRRYIEDNLAGARRLAEWKTKVRRSWSKVSLRRLDTPKRRMEFGDSIRFEIAAWLDALAPEDVTVELFMGRPGAGYAPSKAQCYKLQYQHRLDSGENLYVLDLTPELCGRIECRIRIYPSHELLTHPFEMGMMVWL